MSGFRKCGIFPFNPNEEYKSLPTSNILSPNKAMDQSVIDVLQQLRGEDEQLPGPSKRRRTKLDVQPGKSVVVDESDENSESDGSDSEENSSSDKENTVFSDSESDSGDDRGSVEEEEGEELEEIPFKELKFEMWVVVEYEDHRFLGQVQETVVGKVDGRIKKKQGSNA